MSNNIKLPSTDTPPDNVYLGSDVVSWNFEVDGQEARLGLIQPNFEGEFPVDERGEQITLVKPEEGAELVIEELDGSGNTSATHVLAADQDEVFIEGGKNMKVATRGKIVEYVCVYPDK